MSAIRVLIADDSETMRAALAAVLGADPAFQVVGSAADGRAVVEQALALRPDVITMDVLMPGLDGLDATAAIMARAPTRVVVIASVSQARQAELSFRAIAAGALEAIAKPAGSHTDLAAWGARVRRTVRLLSEVPVVTRRPAGGGPPRHLSASGGVDVIGIAASTGGPPALAQLFSALPATLPVPLLVAQHLTPGFTTGLVRWLNDAGPVRVSLAKPGEMPRPGCAYLPPDGCHLEVDLEGLLQTPPAVAEGPVPDANRLFHSLARAYGARGGGVVLTGMGEDGADGLLALHRAGGTTLAQDEASAVVYGMPKAAMARGAVTFQLPLDQLAPCLIALAGPPSPAAFRRTS